MATDTLIDGHVSVKQCKLAIEALHANYSKFTEKQRETELLAGKEPNLWLSVTVKKIASAHKFKPVKIPIVHPLVDPRISPVCLITKDPQREYKDLLEERGVKFISRVVGIEKLKGKFKSFEARRMLLKENGLFLADERVVPLLPKLLGVKWFKAKKQPIPVCLTRKDLKGELERAISSTYMNQNQGTCTSVKISTMSQTAAQALENLQRALPAIISHIKGEWDNIQSLLLKTNSSAGLPIWSCDLGAGDGGRWAGLVAVDDAEAESGLEADDEEMVVEEKQVEKPPKGKKRAVVEEVEQEESKKKAKGADGKALSSGKAQEESRKRVKGVDGKVLSSPAVGKVAAEQTKKAKGAEQTVIRDEGVKPKKRKSDVIPPAAIPLPPVSSSVATPQAKDPGSAQKSKREKPTASASGDAPITEEAEKKSKSKPSKAPAAGALAVVEPKKKKASKGSEAAGVSPDAPEIAPPASKKKRAKSDKDTSASLVAPTDTVPEKKAEKGAVAPVLSSDELKQKRVGKPGEKKKEGVLKGKSGSVKSAKDKVIGKKRAA